MGYAKERGKLEKLSGKIVGLDIYNEKNFAILVDSHEKYSHTIRILKNKEPELFMDLYTNELQQIKESRKAVKESETDEARQSTFILYRDTLVAVMEKTINITKETN
ncbi:hypothetical protein H9X96_21070 [Pedobacter sp. N36a]|uniref:hypothetical protein n=1 Tax=Pedobacter sp. N36a TaxID=2767996 RepID=UPI001657310F|nr:hypothetical protein [Pedobacter sp. N36a]MBC8988254.1 hypothetical protein [Pedobacter sp. N36a]